MAHEICPDEDNQLLDLGRLLHEESYKRDHKELSAPGMRIDILRTSSPGNKGSHSNLGSPGEELVVCEVKKSVRFLKPAKMQLCFYLWKLKQQGVIARGELLVPKKKKRIPVELTPALETELERIMSRIEKLVAEPNPPPVVKNKFCRKCAYHEFCYA